MKTLYIVLAVLLIFSACGPQKERIVVKEKSLPAWYFKPPSATDNIIYSVGEGINKQEAIDNALSSLLATLSVSISSKFSAKSIIKEGQVNSKDATYINETQSEVKKIRISNYEVVEIKKLGFKRYAVLVKVDKRKFFKSLKQELDQKFTAVESWEKRSAKINLLEKLHYYNEVINSFDKLFDTVLVMSVLDNRFDGKYYLNKYEALKNKRDILLKNITFSIVSDDKAFIAPIAKALAEKKIKIQNIHNKNHFTIIIKTDIQKTKSYGFFILRTEFRFVTKDYKNTIFATNTIELNGHSSQSYNIAKQDLVQKLTRLIHEQSIAKILNLDI